MGMEGRGTIMLLMLLLLLLLVLRLRGQKDILALSLLGYIDSGIWATTLGCSVCVQMYKAALQQEEQKAPAFLRMQQEAQAKEAEEVAEKKRRWEEEVASKRFWVRSCIVNWS